MERHCSGASSTEYKAMGTNNYCGSCTTILPSPKLEASVKRNKRQSKEGEIRIGVLSRYALGRKKCSSRSFIFFNRRVSENIVETFGMNFLY